MKKFGAYLLLVTVIVSLSSCNTYIGMGRDVQKFGEGIQNTGYGTGWNGDQASATTPPAPSKP